MANPEQDTLEGTSTTQPDSTVNGSEYSEGDIAAANFAQVAQKLANDANEAGDSSRASARQDTPTHTLGLEDEDPSAYQAKRRIGIRNPETGQVDRTAEYDPAKVREIIHERAIQEDADRSAEADAKKNRSLLGRVAALFHRNPK